MQCIQVSLGMYDSSDPVRRQLLTPDRARTDGKREVQHAFPYGGIHDTVRSL